MGCLHVVVMVLGPWARVATHFASMTVSKVEEAYQTKQVVRKLASAGVSSRSLFLSFELSSRPQRE